MYLSLCNAYDLALSKVDQMELMHEIKLTYAIIHFTASTQM